MTDADSGSVLPVISRWVATTAAGVEAVPCCGKGEAAAEVVVDEEGGGATTIAPPAAYRASRRCEKRY